MKAVVCYKLGDPSNLRLGDLPVPAYAEQQVLIRVHAASVNFPDRLLVQGKYQASPEIPFAPGFEVSGVVIAVGSAVERYRIGDRVMALTVKGSGGYAEQAVADVNKVCSLPDDMDFIAGAAFYSTFGTSYHALVQRAAVQKGEVLVVLAAAGGIGITAISIGKALGAKVIAVASSAEKLSIAKAHGADECINYKDEDLRERILELTDGRGADICFDPVGGELFDCMSRVMNWNGRLLVLGFSSGKIPSLAANLPLLKCYQMVGVFWDRFLEKFPDDNRDNMKQLLRWYRQGIIKNNTYYIHSIDDFMDAFKRTSSSDYVGKSILRIKT